MTELEIKSIRFGAPVVQRLTTDALADLARRYGGPGDETPVEPADFDPPEGGFFIAVYEGEPIGCGGWRSHEDSYQVAELKRLYVAPSGRGRGVARALLAAIENSARDLGRTRMILECGTRQPEAISLYESAGYLRIENFGFYKDRPLCVSFGRDL